MDIADRDGLGALTMRRLGAELTVEAMSLYKHVANKDEILDGLVELVMSEIDVPEGVADWREAMRRRASSAREVLGRHSWAVGLMEARQARGPAVLRYADAILGILRAAGLSTRDAGHAFWLLDSYVYGHVLQEAGSPEGADGTDPDPASIDAAAFAEFTNLAAVMELSSVFSHDSAFEFGLELILDGLERRRATGPVEQRPDPGSSPD